MILKPSKGNLAFEEIRKIRLGEPLTQSYRENVTTDEEFLDTLLKRYTVLNELVEQASAQRTGIRREFARVGKQFIIVCLLAMDRRLPFDDPILNKSQSVYLDKEFSINHWKELASSLPNVITTEDLIDFQEEIERFEIQYQTVCRTYRHLLF